MIWAGLGISVPEYSLPGIPEIEHWMNGDTSPNRIKYLESNGTGSCLIRASNAYRVGDTG